MPGRKSVLWLAAAAISVLTFATVSMASGSTRERPCNGSVELCARNFDQVVLPGTHNSMSNEEYGWLIPNQHFSIPTQLEMGVRGFLIDTHYGKPNGDGTVADVAVGNRNDPGVGLYLCHAYCTLGASELVPELAKIADFLRSHPREVLNFMVEDELVPADMDRAVTESGLIDFVYTGSTDTYPTLAEMISSGQRVVLLSERSTGDVPWYHYGYGGPMQETPYNFLSDQAGTKLTPRQGIDLLTTPATLDSTCRPNRGGNTGPLFLMNHWVNGLIGSTKTGGDNNIAPDPAVARILNQPDVLTARARACLARRDKLPTLIAVDDFGEGDLTAAVRELNGVTAKPFFEVAKPKNATVKSGKKATFKVALSNWGDIESALTKVCATVPGKLAVKPKCATLLVPQGNPGKATATIRIATRKIYRGRFKGKKSGRVNFTISGAGDQVKTSANIKVTPLKPKKKTKGKKKSRR